MNVSIKAKLLIVEDEPKILRGLIDLFVFHGFEVDSESDGAKGLNRALNGQYECIILDVMLPSMNGFDICNAIRQHSKSQPIIMLTAKSSEQDIINGLSLGADDYIAKPFSIQELVLRVKSILRRSGWSEDKTELCLGEGLTIDVENLTGKTSNGTIDFTRREVEILQLLNSRNTPVSRQTLLSQVWGYKISDVIDTRTVDIHIAKLRKKIEKDAKQPELLITFRGEGYKLNT